MNRIHAALEIEEWSPDTLDIIAEIVTASGREIKDSTVYADEDDVMQGEPDEEGRHLLGTNPDPQPEPPYDA